VTRKPTTRDLSDKHEAWLAALLNGRVTRGSGSAFADQMDGKNDRHEQAHPLAWDGKATQGKSVGVSREMWAKAVEQSHGLTTALALRFYGSGYGLAPELDLIAVEANDFAAILEDARAYRRIREAACLTGGHRFEGSSDCAVCGTSGYDLPEES
jgi:hypothetical protein